MLLTNEPGSQTAKSVQLGEFVAVLNWSIPHGVQSRSWMEVGKPVTYEPGSQTSQSAQVGALIVALNFPPAQTEQRRFCVGDGGVAMGLLTKDPGSQIAKSAQLEALVTVLN